MRKQEQFSQQQEIQKKQEYLLKESLKHIDVGNNPPHLISIIGPNRSGTTAFTEIFARLGIPNYLQPIKSIRRAIEENDTIPTFQVHQNIPLAVHKETLGSTTESEFFNPIEALLKAGYPPEKIHLIAMMRDPEMTLTSWNRIYKEKVNVPGLARAIQQTVAIARNAEAKGISTSHYVHEMARDNHTEMVAAQLFNRIGLQINNHDTVKQTVDWTQGARFGSDGSTGIFYDRPPEIFVEGVKTRPGYQFDVAQQVNISAEQRTFLQKTGSYDFYRYMAQRAIQDTGLVVNMSKRYR